MSPPAVSRRRPPSQPVSTATAAMGGDLFGPFRFMERIERGGPAELYRALWSEAPVPSERSCLVKRLRPELASSPAFRRMFAEEARIMVYLRHPGVARVYAHGEIEGLPYLATEPLDGLSLARLLGAHRAGARKLPIEVVAYIAQQVAAALAHAHSATDTEGCPLSIVHRDVRPANVMLLPTGQVKLVDFGVARMASFVSQSANLAGAGNVPGQGKAFYASPEQLMGAPLDGRSDLFSLGVSMWEMLVGRPLFPPGPAAELAARVLQASLAAPSSVRPDVPRALDDIVMHLLERERGRRYPSAEALTRDLAEFLPVPKDASRAVVSMVRTASAAPLSLPGTTPGARPGTSVVPNAAGLLGARGKMMALAGRIPGSIRRVTGMVPAFSSARKPGAGAPAVDAPGAPRPLRPAPVPVRRLALQAALAATLSFAGGVLWQEVRVDAAVLSPPRSSAPPPARSSGVIIERLPSRSAPSRPAEAAPERSYGHTPPAAQPAAATRVVGKRALASKRPRHGSRKLPRRHQRR